MPDGAGERGGERMTIKVGVIGAGVMGADHARILATSVAGAELVAVSDPDVPRRNALASDLGVTSTHDDAMALIADPAVEAVIVASPDPTHKPLTLACLDAGKPVLCEKPLATSAADCLEIVRREMEFGRRLVQVGFMRRFDPGYVSMKRMLTSEELGAPLIFLSAQLALGMRPWLPRVIADRSMARKDFSAVVTRAQPWLARGEALLRPRLGWMSSPPAERLVGIVCFLLAIVLFLPIPLGNMLPAFAICVMALGVLERDGIWIAAGLVVSVLSAGLVWGIVYALLKAAFFLIAQVF